MRHRLIAVGICMALILCLLPATALAYTAPDSQVYNDHDYNALKTFLDATSANGSDINGVMACGSDYSADPATWDGVLWVDVSGELRVQRITWEDCELNGTLDLSNCTSLIYLDVMSFTDTTANSIDSFVLSGCTALLGLWCWYCPITELDLSGLTALQTADCSHCESLTSLTLTGCSNLQNLYCDDCPLGTLVLGSAFPNLKYLSCGGCSLTSLDLSDNPNLESVRCDYNDFTSFDVTGLSNLKELIMGDSPSLVARYQRSDRSGAADLLALRFIFAGVCQYVAGTCGLLV